MTRDSSFDTFEASIRFLPQDTYFGINGIGSHFDSLPPVSPASRSEDEIDLSSKSEENLAPHLSFDLTGGQVDFVPFGVDDQARIGSQNGYLGPANALPAQHGAGQSSDGPGSWIPVVPPSTASSSYVILTPQTANSPYAPSVRSTSPSGDLKPVIGLSKAWELPPKQKRGRKPVVQLNRESAKKKHLQNATATSKGIPRRKGPLSEVSKQEIKEIKALGGACCACRYKKNKCRLPSEIYDGTCHRCVKLHPALCYRYSINEASLYREQNAPYHLFSKRWKSMDLVNIQDWASSDPREDRIIVVSQVFLNAPYQVRVRKFRPQPGDLLKEIWHDGDIERHFPIPPYAIVDMEEAAQAIGEMTEKYLHEYLFRIIEQEHAAGGGDFIWSTFLFAFKHIQNIEDEDTKILIRQAFRMWQACRLTSYPEAIVGTETLGLRQSVTDPSSPWADQFPTPPVMGAQLECILYSKFLRPWSSQIRNLLDKVIRKGSRMDWLSVYLTLFVLLHSCALLIDRDYKYARQLGLKEEYANDRAVRDHRRGAITLIAHFQIVLGGAVPFGLAAQHRSASSKKNLDFTAREEEFVAWTYNEVRKMDLNSVRQRKDPKNVWYWLSQLYDEDWRPDKMD